jgi:hypothetical protein
MAHSEERFNGFDSRLPSTDEKTIIRKSSAFAELWNPVPQARLVKAGAKVPGKGEMNFRVTLGTALSASAGRAVNPN